MHLLVNAKLINSKDRLSVDLDCEFCQVEFTFCQFLKIEALLLKNLLVEFDALHDDGFEVFALYLLFFEQDDELGTDFVAADVDAADWRAQRTFTDGFQCLPVAECQVSQVDILDVVFEEECLQFSLASDVFGIFGIEGDGGWGDLGV